MERDNVFVQVEHKIQLLLAETNNLKLKSNRNMILYRKLL